MMADIQWVWTLVPPHHFSLISYDGYVGHIHPSIFYNLFWVMGTVALAEKLSLPSF